MHDERGRGRPPPKDPGAPELTQNSRQQLFQRATGAPAERPPTGGTRSGPSPLAKPVASGTRTGATPGQAPASQASQATRGTSSRPAVAAPVRATSSHPPVAAPARATSSHPPVSSGTRNGPNPLLQPVSGGPRGGPDPFAQSNGGRGTNSLLQPVRAPIAEDDAFPLETGPDKFSTLHPLPPEVEVPLKGGAPALVSSGNLGWNESAPPDGRAPGIHRPGPPTPAMERLLASAAQQFSERGFNRTTIEGLAEATGFPRQRLLAAFKSKEGLYVRVLQAQVDQLVASVRKELKKELPAPKLMQILSERGFVDLTGNPLLLKLVMGISDEYTPGWEDYLDKLRKRLVDLVSEVLKLGVAQGLIRQEVELETVAGLIFELHVSGHLLHHRSAPDKEQRAAHRRAAALDMIFNGLRRRA